MDSTISLNDRRYRLCDMGEGVGTIVITFAKNIDDLYEYYCQEYLKLERVIILDASECWGETVVNLTELECDLLVSDVLLLANVYWLERYSTKVEQGNTYLEERLKIQICI